MRDELSHGKRTPGDTGRGKHTAGKQSRGKPAGEREVKPPDTMRAISGTDPRGIVGTRTAPVAPLRAQGVGRTAPAKSGGRLGGARVGVLAPNGIVDTRTSPVSGIARRGVPRPRVAAPAAGAVAAGVTYQGGPLITNVEITAFYWGSAWSDPGLSGLASQLNQFFADFTEGLPGVGSPIDQLAEYSQGQYQIGRGTFLAPGWFVTPSVYPDPAATVDDTAIQAALPTLISAFNLQQDANSLFFVFTPPNVTVTKDGGATQSCTTFCGYHGHVGSTYYAVMPYPCTSGCTGSLTIFDALTLTCSHEISEAVTDPDFTGWWDSTTTGNEIGDFCGWATKQFGPYVIQQEWSNNAGGCV